MITDAAVLLEPFQFNLVHATFFFLLVSLGMFQFTIILQ